jgi:hypothetical protein
MNGTHIDTQSYIWGTARVSTPCPHLPSTSLQYRYRRQHTTHSWRPPTSKQHHICQKGATYR